MWGMQAIAAAQAIAARLSGQSAPVASAPGSYGHQPYSYGTPQQPLAAAQQPQQQQPYAGLGPAGQAAAAAATPSWQSGGSSYGVSGPAPSPAASSGGAQPFSYDKINSEQLAGRGGAGGGRSGGGAPPAWQQNSSVQQAYMTGRYGSQQVRPHVLTAWFLSDLSPLQCSDPSCVGCAEWRTAAVGRGQQRRRRRLVRRGQGRRRPLVWRQRRRQPVILRGRWRRLRRRRPRRLTLTAGVLSLPCGYITWALIHSLNFCAARSTLTAHAVACLCKQGSRAPEPGGSASNWAAAIAAMDRDDSDEEDAPRSERSSQNRRAREPNRRERDRDRDRERPQQQQPPPSAEAPRRKKWDMAS
jgi:hypothetical protein